MASRIKVVKNLKKCGITPKDEKYSEHVTRYLNHEFKVKDDITEKNESLIKKIAGEFSRKVKKFYIKDYKYNFKSMLKYKSDWFGGVIKNPLAPTDEPKKGRPKKNKGGRPTKDYSNSGESAKLQKANEAMADHSFEKLIHSLIIRSSKEGHNDAAYVLKKLREDPKLNAKKFRSSMEKPPKPVIVMTPKESLATLLEMKFTQRHSIYIWTVIYYCQL